MAKTIAIIYTINNMSKVGALGGAELKSSLLRREELIIMKNRAEG